MVLSTFTVNRFTITIIDKDGETLVKFYDNKYAGAHPGWELGQMVSTYYADTIIEHEDGVGLKLYGKEPAWVVPGEDMNVFKRYISAFVATMSKV